VGILEPAANSGHYEFLVPFDLTRIFWQGLKGERGFTSTLDGKGLPTGIIEGPAGAPGYIPFNFRFILLFFDFIFCSFVSFPYVSCALTEGPKGDKGDSGSGNGGGGGGNFGRGKRGRRAVGLPGNYI